VLYGIGLHACGDLVHETFLRERVLQASRRTQRSGEERRWDRMGEYTLAGDRARAVVCATDAAGHICRDSVLSVVKVLGVGRLRARLYGLWRKAKQQPRRDVARRVIPWTVTEVRGPRLVIPRDDVAVGVEPGLLIHHERQTVVLTPDHFVLARELHTYGFPD